ncbi:MAG: copper-binding protein [Pseudomonadota bacterium]
MKAIHLKTFTTIAAAMVLSASLPSYAAEDMSKMDMKTPMPDAAAATEGVVKKIDKDAGKITIKHGPISNLQMPGMTMVFRVADPAMLNQVKEGDKVKFHVEKMNGALTITKIEGDK